MPTPRVSLLAGLIVAAAMAAETAKGQPPTDTESFPTGLYLIGIRTLQDPVGCGIAVFSPADGKRETVFHRDSGDIYGGGRFSRQGDKLAFCYVPSDGNAQIMVIDATGTSVRTIDAEGMITSWSPDGRKLALYGEDVPGGTLQSYVIDVSSGKRTKVDLPADYVADDWHPRNATRTAMYMNPRNRLYRAIKGDAYPARQIDLVADDGERSPITKNPCTDNIWSRFSPDGTRIAHYGRRLDGERPLEYVVVCAADGSRPEEILNFTRYGESVGLAWFGPNGPPAWSPDGSALAWIVRSNAVRNGDGDELELVVVSVDSGDAKRTSLSDRGIEWVSGLEWR